MSQPATEPHLVTLDRHGARRWMRFKDYHFAAAQNVAPVAAAELSHVARALPLGFVQQGDRTVPVALLGLLPGRNLLVAPDGRWLGSYIPAAFRGHPFRLGHSGQGDQYTLMVDEASGLVSEGDEIVDGVPFFEAEGKPHPETQRVLQFLLNTHQSMTTVANAAAALAAKGLLEPWPLTVKNDESERRVDGVSRVKESALAALSPDDLAELRDRGALALAYAQLISMGNLTLLSTLAQAHDRLQQANAARMTIPEGSFLDEDDGNLKIDWDSFLKN